MRTRTWLTTPPGQAPSDDRPADGEERYVPAPGPPREPRVPGRHRWAIAMLVAVLLALVATLTLVLIGEPAQREDPSVPGGRTDRPEAPDELELPEP